MLSEQVAGCKQSLSGDLHVEANLSEGFEVGGGGVIFLLGQIVHYSV